MQQEQKKRFRVCAVWDGRPTQFTQIRQNRAESQNQIILCERAKKKTHITFCDDDDESKQQSLGWFPMNVCVYAVRAQVSQFIYVKIEKFCIWLCAAAHYVHFLWDFLSFFLSLAFPFALTHFVRTHFNFHLGRFIHSIPVHPSRRLLTILMPLMQFLHALAHFRCISVLSFDMIIDLAHYSTQRGYQYMQRTQWTNNDMRDARHREREKKMHPVSGRSFCYLNRYNTTYGCQPPAPIKLNTEYKYCVCVCAGYSLRDIVAHIIII